MEAKEAALKIKKLLLPAPCGQRISLPVQLAGSNLQLIAIKGQCIGPTVLIRGTLQGLENAGAVACLALSHELEKILYSGKVLFCLSEDALEPAARQAEHWLSGDASWKPSLTEIRTKKQDGKRRHADSVSDTARAFAAEAEAVAGFGTVSGAPQRKNSRFWQFESSSYQLTAFAELVTGVADYFIDLRGCGSGKEILPHAATFGQEARLFSEIARLLDGLHLHYMLRTSTEDPLLYALASCRLPAVALSAGAGELVQTAAVQLHKNNVRLLLTKLNMLREDSMPPCWEQKPQVLGKQERLKFPCSGMLKTYLPAGTRLHRGDVILRILDAGNGAERCLRCPVEGVLLQVCTERCVQERELAASVARCFASCV